MKIEIKKPYLIFPVNTLSSVKKLSFRKKDETVYRLNIRLDNVAPNFYAYIDVARFMGQTLDLSVAPQMQLHFRESDEMDIRGLYREPMRPQIHFTTQNGWLNDPNGLVFLDGTYHMFYQHNPAEPEWGNMHWGHAESRDLIHWEEKGLALFPDVRGAMFSGSAVLDEKGLLGKNSGDRKAVALFYTTTEPFCQNLSYSVDGFRTIEHYPGNPVIPHIVEENRDPKVIYCEELGCYVMALYLEKEIFGIFASENLTKWKQLQCIELKGDAECPDIFPLCAEDGSRKWVLMGAHDKYLVGRFENGEFVAEQPVMSLHYGASAYAGQTFSNLPGGRIVRMVWDTWHLPADGFKSQMGIPMEFKLRAFEERYYLEANPVRELESIYKNTQRFENIALAPEQEYRVALEDAPYVFKLKGALCESGVWDMEIFGNTVHLDFGKNEIKLGSCTAPISITRSSLDLTVVVDRCSIELFSDSGKIFLSCLDRCTVADRNLPYLTLKADTQTQLQSVEVTSLHSIWSDC